MADLPRFVLDLLSACPAAGAGVHSWIFRCARQLHAHRGPAEIADLLEASAAGCGRDVPRHEIEEAVENSRDCAWKPGGRAAGAARGPRSDLASPERPRKPRWPAVNEPARASVLSGGFALVDLWEASPVRLDGLPSETDHILETLFPGDPLLCLGWSNRDFGTGRLSEWTAQRDISTLQFIVPSPMVSEEGSRKKDGKLSPHTLSNTGPRRFLVCEFDSGTKDDHAAFLSHLADFAPLVMAVHSGGKSLHGWFDFDGIKEERTREFFEYAVSLGADPATWTRSQFVRLPGGTRDDGRRQAVWYFDPPDPLS